MRGIPIERSTVDYVAEWENYYAQLKTDEAKWSLFSMLRGRRDKQGDATAGKALELLVSKWMKEKSR